MDLLLIGDGSQYIDLNTAQAFHSPTLTYYKSMQGIWVRKESSDRLGKIVTEREAFKGFLRAGMFQEAKESFPGLFERGSEVQAPVESDASSIRTGNRQALRIMAGILLGLLLGAYVAAVIAGAISPSHQINVAGLGLIVVGLTAIIILVRPQLLENIQILELGSVKLQLRELEGKQLDQKKELDELGLTLRLLVTEGERRHLKNLKEGTTRGYKKNDSLEAELRRLRNIGLITSKNYISAMPDSFDLREWGVELTPNGFEYLKRWEEANESGGSS